MARVSKPPLALIAGPTASGKSALALALAEAANGVIVNADSAQIYADLPILSAAPTKDERDRAEHRLYGAYLHEWGQPGERHEGIGVPTDVDLTSGYFRYGGLIEGDRCVLYFERRPIHDPKTGRAIDWRSLARNRS